MGNQYKMLKVYTSIERFDTFFAGENIREKEAQVLNYINEEM